MPLIGCCCRWCCAFLSAASYAYHGLVGWTLPVACCCRWCCAFLSAASYAYHGLVGWTLPVACCCRWCCAFLSAASYAYHGLVGWTLPIALLPLVLRVPERGVVCVPRTRRLDAAGGGACGRHQRGREDNNDGECPTEPDVGKEHGCLPWSGLRVRAVWADLDTRVSCTRTTRNNQPPSIARPRPARISVLQWSCAAREVAVSAEDAQRPACAAVDHRDDVVVGGVVGGTALFAARIVARARARGAGRVVGEPPPVSAGGAAGAAIGEPARHSTLTRWGGIGSSCSPHQRVPAARLNRPDAHGAGRVRPFGH